MCDSIVNEMAFSFTVQLIVEISDFSCSSAEKSEYAWVHVGLTPKDSIQTCQNSPFFSDLYSNLGRLMNTRV